MNGDLIDVVGYCVMLGVAYYFGFTDHGGHAYDAIYFAAALLLIEVAIRFLKRLWRSWRTR